jgi:hypothetical protein
MRFKYAGAHQVRYGFHSISTALAERVLLQARKDNTFHRARATNETFSGTVGEELSQSLARPESIGVLACEAAFESVKTPTQVQFTTVGWPATPDASAAITLWFVSYMWQTAMPRRSRYLW